VAIAARMLLGAVFLGSGVLKLRDPQWPPAAQALGVPSALIGVVAPFEIALGALLAAGVAPTPTVVVALVALAAFTVVLARVVGRPVGERPRCACFGRWSSRPVTVGSLLRNLGFVLLGLVALWG
jgi:hypothetical protein